MRALRRESLRATVFLCRTPFETPRCISGWAAMKAVFAAALSPLAIASSTFLTKVRMRLSRALLTSVRFKVWRLRFSADLWVAILDLRAEAVLCAGGGLISGLPPRRQ